MTISRQATSLRKTGDDGDDDEIWQLAAKCIGCSTNVKVGELPLPLHPLPALPNTRGSLM